MDHDIGCVKDTESDSDSVVSGQESANFAAARGKVMDDDDDSVVTDDNGAQEETPLDDQARPRKTASDVTALTTHRGNGNSSIDDTKSPPSNMVTGSYKFQIGSSQNVFRRTRGGGR